MPILVVDDQVNSRATTVDWVQNTFGDGEAISQDEPLQSVAALIERVRRDHIDTVVLDYKMPQNYAPSNGLVLANELFDAHVASVIVSSYVESGLPKFFWLGAKVPAVLPRSEISSGLRAAVEQAQRRMRGDYSPHTLPSRTLVRILSIGDGEAGLVVPAYRNDGKLVELAELQSRLPDVELRVGMRLMARVNLGAPNLDQLYVSDLELAPELDEKHARLLRR